MTSDGRKQQCSALIGWKKWHLIDDGDVSYDSTIIAMLCSDWLEEMSPFIDDGDVSYDSTIITVLFSDWLEEVALDR